MSDRLSSNVRSKLVSPIRPKSHDIKSSSIKSRWIEMFPYGLTLNPGQARPVMIFKDKSKTEVLPVWMSPVDAGIAVTQNMPTVTDSSPHNLTWKILDPMGVTLEKCFFKEIRGHHQIVDLQFKGSDKLKKIESRAEEALSFCLSSKCRFFTQKDFINKCRNLDAEMLQFAVSQGEAVNPYPYLN